MTVGEGFTWHPFDLEFGVRTSGLIAGRNLKSGSQVDRHNTAYFGIAPSVFHEMIARWRRLKPAGDIDEYTFVDIGAGMGRALLLASELSFRSVIGVELNRDAGPHCEKEHRSLEGARAVLCACSHDSRKRY